MKRSNPVSLLAKRNYSNMLSSTIAADWRQMFASVMNQVVMGRTAAHAKAAALAETGDYLRQIERLPGVAPDEEKSLGTCIKRGSKDEAKEARRCLIAANLWLVGDIS